MCDTVGVNNCGNSFLDLSSVFSESAKSDCSHHHDERGVSIQKMKQLFDPPMAGKINGTDDQLYERVQKYKAKLREWFDANKD